MAEKLSASQRAKVRRLSEPKELSPDEEGGELNVVPFLDIITNVMMFVLATVTVTFTARIDTSPPRMGGSGRSAPTVATLSLNVVVLKDGFLVSAVGRRIAPGCSGEGSGLAVGLGENGVHNYSELTDCVKKLKNLAADFQNERQVTLSANKDIPYQVVVSTIDALRKSKTGEELFPEVNFGVAK